MSKPPAFQFYPGDFLSSPDVQLMTTIEVGAYLLLLCAAWLNDCRLTTDEDRLRRLARLTGKQWEQSGPLLLSKFPMSECGTFRANPRLTLESEKLAVFRAEKRIAGKKGAASRWGDGTAIKNDGTANRTTVILPLANDSSSSSTSSSEEESINVRVIEDRPVEKPPGMPTLEEVKSYASDSAITADCAEKWYWANDAENWQNRFGRPLANWRSSLRSYWTTWAENNRRGGSFMQPSRPIADKKPKPPTRPPDPALFPDGKIPKGMTVNQW